MGAITKISFGHWKQPTHLKQFLVLTTKTHPLKTNSLSSSDRKQLVLRKFLKVEDDLNLARLVLTKHPKSPETFCHRLVIKFLVSSQRILKESRALVCGN